MEIKHIAAFVVANAAVVKHRRASTHWPALVMLHYLCPGEVLTWHGARAGVRRMGMWWLLLTDMLGADVNMREKCEEGKVCCG